MLIWLHLTRFAHLTRFVDAHFSRLHYVLTWLEARGGVASVLNDDPLPASANARVKRENYQWIKNHYIIHVNLHPRGYSRGIIDESSLQDIAHGMNRRMVQRWKREYPLEEDKKLKLQLNLQFGTIGWGSSSRLTMIIVDIAHIEDRHRLGVVETRFTSVESRMKNRRH